MLTNRLTKILSLVIFNEFQKKIEISRVDFIWANSN